MRYFGGKTRICKEISEIINNTIKEGNFKTFVSPFVGAGWVEQHIKCEKKILNDKHNYLISMYKQLQKGWLPPKELTREEYEHIKNNKDDKPYLTGFVGFGCSFSGKWFGGYAKDKTERNYCLNAHNSIVKKTNNGLLRNAEMLNKDYKELDFKNCLIYCDPPYKGTTQYDKNVVGEFDHDEFWNKIRKWSKDNEVYISEYDAPCDFEVVWEKEIRLDIRDSENKKKKRTEKLFKMKGKN